MGMIRFILWQFILGVLLFIVNKDPAKPTWNTIKDDLSQFKGPMVRVWTLLYFVMVLCILTMYPFVYLANLVNKWVNR